MKPFWLAAFLALLSLACQREEEAGSKSASAAVSGRKATKVTDRGASKKSIPMAEPVPDQPGFVLSPYNGNIVDVTGVPANTVVADPGFPAAEEKQFRVPEMAGMEQENLPPPDFEAAKAEARTAAAVPGKPGFIICPWDQREFDASGFEPGSMIMDPSSTPQVPRFLKVPDDHIQPE